MNNCNKNFKPFVKIEKNCLYNCIKEFRSKCIIYQRLHFVGNICFIVVIVWWRSTSYWRTFHLFSICSKHYLEKHFVLFVQLGEDREVRSMAELLKYLWDMYLKIKIKNIELSIGMFHVIPWLNFFFIHFQECFRIFRSWSGSFRFRMIVGYSFNLIALLIPNINIIVHKQSVKFYFTSFVRKAFMNFSNKQIKQTLTTINQ